MQINHMAFPKVQNEKAIFNVFENHFDFAVHTHLCLIP